VQQARGGLSQWFSIGVSPDPRDMATPRGPLPQSDAATVNPDLQLLEESLPSVFQSTSLWTKFKEEMRVYHRWLGILFYYSPEFPRYEGAVFVLEHRDHAVGAVCDLQGEGAEDE
jgi:hypothetical protein